MGEKAVTKQPLPFALPPLSKTNPKKEGLTVMASFQYASRSLLVLAALLLCPATGLPAGDEPERARPNFIVINIDDLGYADVGPFGSRINRTPNLDAMAKEGRRLTSFYAAPVGSPSRAALMTSCYPKRCLPIPHVLFPGNDVGLSPDEVTVAAGLLPT